MKSPVILVVRADDQFSTLLRSSGCEVLNLELISTAPSSNLTALDELLHRIDDYDGLFFTSPVSADVFVERSKAFVKSFLGKVYVLGRRARTILEVAGFDVVFAGDANTAEEFIGSLEQTEFEGKRFLYVRGNKSLRTITNLLAGIAVVDEVTVYETKPMRTDNRIVGSVRKRLSDGEIEWVCFFSPSAVDSFCRLFPAENLKRLKAAVIGETTSRTARDRGMNVEFISVEATADCFAAGLIGQINKH